MSTASDNAPHVEDRLEGPVISTPDALSRDRMRAVFAATPRGLSLGRLREVAVQVAGWTGEVPPPPITQSRIVIFAGDHGISQREVSAYAPEASVEMAEEIQAGGSPGHVLARAASASLRLVDTSLDREAWGEERVSRSTGRIDLEDAMTEDMATRAMSIGANIADQEIDAGADILLPGDLGVGLTTVAAAVMGTLTRTEPVAVVGPGSGVTDEMWKRKVAAIRDAMFRARDVRDQPLEVLRRIGSPDLIALVGFITQAARRRTPLLIDGTGVSTAAFVADLLNPGVHDWCMAAQLSAEPAHIISLQKMGLTPLLALDMSTGQATGSLAALPLIKAAVEIAGDEAATVASGIAAKKRENEEG